MKIYIIHLVTLATLCHFALNSSAQPNRYSISTSYFQKGRIDSVANTITQVTDTNFSFFLNNMAVIDALMGKNYSKIKLQTVIYSDIIRPLVSENSSDLDWKLISNKVEPFGKLGLEIYLRARIIQYARQKKWSKLAPIANKYWKDFPCARDEMMMNNYAWGVLTAVNDKKLLLYALSWSKIAKRHQTEPAFIDTYANLLYKIGRVKAAIKAERMAVDFALKNNQSPVDFELVLAKMEKNEIIW